MKYFILGDSRTGTTSLHQYFLSAGVSSIHHYENDAEILIPYKDDNYIENCKRIKNFIERSGYFAFSDYPTRLFYKCLYENYPTSFFILTVRRDIEIWKRSMVAYFNALGITFDMNNAQFAYAKFNMDIENFFKMAGGRFLTINIDDDCFQNEIKLNLFTGLKGNLGRWNSLQDHLDYITQNGISTNL